MLKGGRGLDKAGVATYTHYGDQKDSPLLEGDEHLENGGFKRLFGDSGRLDLVLPCGILRHGRNGRDA
jgi:hypothetical protein